MPETIVLYLLLDSFPNNRTSAASAPSAPSTHDDLQPTLDCQRFTNARCISTAAIITMLHLASVASTAGHLAILGSRDLHRRYNTIALLME